ncbi:hypothetical protein [Cellvibrio sp. QJXJ]|uniref:hypothetical protein n=1 Tax=Cellvibrio sp. QJXJ TaxID=2964606 RepID=UPI0021C35174|nr:hypothetical protein [Cellvibrio sp. QJXJ]UUA75166.1 hypothetical protein NNX04_22170 [Cellvibrio sp. QJXJ]
MGNALLVCSSTAIDINQCQEMAEAIYFHTGSCEGFEAIEDYSKSIITLDELMTKLAIIENNLNRNNLKRNKHAESI